MRRVKKTKGPKHLALSATDEEWELVRHNARRRGLSIARYVVGLVERDAGAQDASPDVTLSPAEQRALVDGVREIGKLMLEGENTGSLVRDMRERVSVQFTGWAMSMATAGPPTRTSRCAGHGSGCRARPSCRGQDHGRCPAASGGEESHGLAQWASERAPVRMTSGARSKGGLAMADNAVAASCSPVLAADTGTTCGLTVIVKERKGDEHERRWRGDVKRPY